MSTIFLYLEVEDYKRFKRVFDSYQNIRTGHGITSHRVYQDIDDPNRVTVSVDIVSQAVAASFLGSSKLQAFLHDVGVKGTPAIWVTREVEEIAYARTPVTDAASEAPLLEAETIL